MNTKTAIYIAALVGVASVASASRAHAGTFYVAQGGSDSASGASSAPWKTLQHAAGRVGPGDTVVVRKGRYAGFQLTRSGSDGQPIVFRAEAGAQISGDNPRTPDGINLEGASHVVIEGFTVSGAGRAGIRAVTCQKVTLRGNRITGNGKWGVFTGFCDDLLIEDNDVSKSGQQHGVYASNSGDRPVIRRNRIWGNPQNGIHLNGDASMGGDGLVTGAVVEENVIYGNGDRGGSAINGDGLERSVIQNNLLYDNHANGIALYRIDAGGPSRGNVIRHNTIVMPSKSRWCIRLYDGATGNTVRNNILLSAHDRRGAMDVSKDSVRGLDSDYNLVIGRYTLDDAESIIDLAAWRKATGQDAHSREATAGQLFAGKDYALKKGAPAIDRGGPADLTRDLAGNTRPVGGAVDIGAYEYCTTCTPAPVTASTAPAKPEEPATVDAPALPAAPEAGHARAGIDYGDLTVPPDGGRVYYVAADGSDRADGGESAPWKTLQHAANRARAGDTVIVRPGQYRGFQLERSGERGRPIRFLGERGARISGNNPRTADAINLEGASDIWIEGFDILGASRAGIRAVQCERVTVRKNKIDQSGKWGVFTGFCHDLVVEGNEVSRTDEQHGVYASNSGDRPIIRGNLIWGNRVNGVHLNGDREMGGDGMISGALVEDNVIHGNGAGGGAAINGDGVTGSVIRNNLLYDNQANGIALYRIDAAAGSKDNIIVNNTIVMPARTRWCIRVVDGSTGNTIQNNILLSAHERRGAIDISADSVPGTKSDYNVVIGRFTDDDAESILDLAAWQRKHQLDAHSVVATAAALFVDPAAHDYRLKPGAPAIDKAHGEAPPRDIAARVRPVGPAHDIGAFEACTGDGCVAAELPEVDAGRGGDNRDPALPPRSAGTREGPQYCCGGHGSGSSSAALAVVVLFGLRRRRR